METNQTDKFSDIRPLLDSEVPGTIEKLIADPVFRGVTEPFAKPLTWEQLKGALRNCKTVKEFQRDIVYQLLTPLISKTTMSMTGENWKNLQNGNSHVIISNHRDIVLDAAFLNMLLFDQEMDTTEIAIGDNLLIYPWIKDLVRLNKSFIVRRGVSVREMLEVSKHMSEYIYDTVVNRDQSIWIAQREGRAKDSNDKTQTSLLKMFTLSDSANPLQVLKSLRIIPLAISYEFDPSDYLKAKEFQMKRDNPEHKKTQMDDIENMLTGIQGFKGNVRFRFGKQISEQLEKLPSSIGRNELLEKTANIIDTEIFKNYVFFPINYVAYDTMMGTNVFSDKYSEETIKKFDTYIAQQIQKINLPNKDVDFLHGKIIEMYANPVKNQLSVIG